MKARLALALSLTLASAVLAEERPRARLFLENAGRVSWLRAEHGRIAFDRVVDAKTYAMDVFTVRADGSKRRCVTCDSAIPRGMRGNPEWHPGGEWLVLQAENAHSERRYVNHPAWGVDNDLWLIRKDGSGAQRIWSPPRPGGAALHPRFSEDGAWLVFAERVPTGKPLPRKLRKHGAHGENHWDGWRLHLAHVDLAQSGEAVLSDHRTFSPSGTGFYEPSGFSRDGRRIFYAHTNGGMPYCDDVFSVRIDGTKPRNLSRSPLTWEEHAQPAPRGDRLAFISSRFDARLRFPRDKARELATELYVQRDGGEPVRVTFANEGGGAKRVVSRFAWSPDGKRIVHQVATFDGAQPELWMVELP